MNMYRNGSEVEVFEEECGLWRTGTVIRRETDHTYTIHYNGWTAKYDEVLPSDKIRPKTNHVMLRNRKRYVPGAPRLVKKLEYLVKDDEVHFKVLDEMQHGVVHVNDPFNYILKVSVASTNGLVDVIYDDVCPQPPRSANTHVSKRKSEPRKIATKRLHSVSVPRIKSSKQQSTRAPKSMDDTPARGCTPVETSQYIINEQVVSCGCFLESEKADVHFSITRIQVYPEEIVKMSGYRVRSSGKALFNFGSFQDMVITDPKHSNLTFDAHWKHRINSTMIAAEWRIANQAADQVAEMDRRVRLRSFVRPQLQRAMGAKKRRLAMTVPYESRVDGRLLKLDVANNFNEIYCPMSFHLLDDVFGSKWDCKTLQSRYAFITRFHIKLVPSKQLLEFVAHIFAPSLVEFRDEYRKDTMAHIINSNAQFASAMDTNDQQCSL